MRGVVALPLLNSTLAAIAAPPAPVPDPDSEDESADEEEVPPFRTVYQWGEAFTVYQKDRENHEEHWGALIRELGGDVTFPRLLMKVMFAGHGATPPCASLDPQLLVQMKSFWAWHTKGNSADALKPHDLDHVDTALGRAAVVRCRICYKPCDTGAGAGDVHVACRVASLACNRTRPPREAWFSDVDLPEVATGCGFCGEMVVPPVLPEFYPKPPQTHMM